MQVVLGLHAAAVSFVEIGFYLRQSIPCRTGPFFAPLALCHGSCQRSLHDTGIVAGTIHQHIL